MSTVQAVVVAILSGVVVYNVLVALAPSATPGSTALQQQSAAIRAAAWFTAILILVLTVPS